MELARLDQLAPPMRGLVEAELAPGEPLTWVGQPLPERAAMAQLPFALVGIPFTAFAVFMCVMIITEPPHNAGFFVSYILLPLFCSAFIGAGLWVLSSPYWEMRKARRSAYVITDRRVLLFTEGFRGGVAIRSLAPAQLAEVSRTQRGDGSGDIVLTLRTLSDHHKRARMERVYMFGVPGVKAVEDLLRAMRARPEGDGAA